MVKADASHDYYADLEISPFATEDEIRKAFRNLAKLHHPDRNPGKEVDVVPKFQAVQAAHEILSDLEQKRKYDQDRAKLKANAPALPRRGPVPPTPSAYPPPPRRAPTSATKHNAFSGSANTTRARQPASTAHAEKYATYARAGAQQWEKTKEEAQSKQDAFRGFQQMKPGPSPSGERFAPPHLPRRHPYTAGPRPTSYAPQSAGFTPTSTPRTQKSWDDFDKSGRFTTTGTEPSHGYPGMSRAQSLRKKHGFDPATPGGDEPAAPRSSAYASYVSGERPQVSNPQSYFPDPSPRGSPQMTPQRPARPTPVRARSSSKPEEQHLPERPGLERVSARYSSIGGERTNVSGGGVGRSSSVRNSPIDPGWREPGRGGLRHAYSHEAPSEHGSVSPRSGPPPARSNSSSSDSETSSDEDLAERNWAARPKATPRQSHPHPPSTHPGGPAAANGQTYGTQFPGTSYVRPPSARDTENGRFQSGPHAPPPPPRNQPASQAAFNYVPGFHGARPAAPKPMPSGRNGYPGPGMAHNGPNISPETEAANSQSQSRSRSASQEPTNNRFSASEWDQKFAAEEIFQPSASYNSGKRSPVRPLRPRAKTQSKTRLSPSKGSRNNSSASLSGVTQEDKTTSSEAFMPATSSADEWMEKLRNPNGADNARASGRGSDGSTAKPQATQSGFTFPAPPGGPAYRDASGDAAGAGANGHNGIDMMDIDEPSSVDTPPIPMEGRGSRRSSQANVHEQSRTTGSSASKPHSLHRAPGHVDLDSLSNVPPFKPSNTGLGDFQDLNTTLPFESQASRARPAQPTSNGTVFSSLKALNLPKPPKEVIPPLGNVTQESWIRFTNETSVYMHEWEIFNGKMLDHFVARQAQQKMSLKPNWMTAVGDGPGEDEINQKMQEDPDAGRNLKVGYAAYLQWQEEDTRAMEWWSLAREKHVQAVVELGKVRGKARALAT